MAHRKVKKQAIYLFFAVTSLLLVISLTLVELKLNPKEEYRLHRKFALPLHANFGYAISVWKAQGSEWDKVLLCEESGWPRGQVERKKYLYTGITRAAKKLVVIQKN